MLHYVVTGLLIWLFLGSLMVFVLSSLGLVDQVLAARARRGEPMSGFTFALAMAMSILLWPQFVVAFAKGARARR